MSFHVVGTGPFPVDMLRHDECWPIDAESVAAIALDPYSDGRVGSSRRLVRLEAARRFAPTVGRWQSFGWRVVADDDVEAVRDSIKQAQLRAEARGDGRPTEAELDRVIELLVPAAAPAPAGPLLGPLDLSLAATIDLSLAATIDLSLAATIDAAAAHLRKFPKGGFTGALGPAIAIAARARIAEEDRQAAARADADGGVLEGWNRTTSGTIGQP